MSAKSDARKQFAKEQELEKLRQNQAIGIQAKAAKKEAQTAKLAAMTEPERVKFLKRRKRTKIVLGAIVAAFVLLIAISAMGPKIQPAPAAQAAASPTADAGAQLSCDHFRNVASDISKGLLTDAEMRTKIKEVYNDAWISTSPNIASSATAMLSADTAGDANALKTAFSDFGAACAAIGH